MKTYKMEFTEVEHRFIEKQIDRLRSECMSFQNQMIMEGQFRASGSKKSSDEENKVIKEMFNNLVTEHFEGYYLLKGISIKFEKGYCPKKQVRKDEN